MTKKPTNKTSKNEDTRPIILVVDDVLSILKSVELALKDIGDVHLLSKAEDVMEFLRNNKADIILLDYLMPVLTGFDLIPIIRGSLNHKNTPVIILSSESNIQNVKEAISLGASDYILKPFNPDELKEKVAKHLGIKLTT
jgi:DNA-binding response OmpR family regulator